MGYKALFDLPPQLTPKPLVTQRLISTATLPYSHSSSHPGPLDVLQTILDPLSPESVGLLTLLL